MNPKHTVSDVLDTLGKYLDPIIQAKLEHVLKGLDWTVIMLELDKARGIPPKNYSRGDVQVQLRMLTENLGGLKHPFDDHQRTVSTLGGELRIVRNAFAHGDDFEWIDAWRAADFAVRLLDHLEDAEGAQACEALRDPVLVRLAEQQGLVAKEQSAKSTALVVQEADADADDHEGPAHASEAQQEHSPPQTALEQDDAPPARPLIGVGRQLFQPWKSVVAGPSWVIDELPKKHAKMRLRAVAAEIVDFEGPIALDRLTRLSAAAFGWRRLTKPRLAKISYQVKQVEGVAVDEFGFVWPASIPAAEWHEFRPQSSSSPRAFEEVSPHEVANAARFVKRRDPSLAGTDLKHAVIAIFGRTRLTQSADAHVTTALTLV